MSLFTWFHRQLPDSANEEVFEDAEQFLPPSTDLSSITNDAAFCVPHPVSPDVSPASKCGIISDQAINNDESSLADPLPKKEKENVSEKVNIPCSSAVGIKRSLNNEYAEQKYPIGTRVRKHFYGYDTPFWGIVTRYDPLDQYYGVTYVSDGDQEEYDEFELSQIIVSADYQKGVTDDLPKYGIGTQVGKWFGPEFYFGTVTSYDNESQYYLITYEDDDKEDVEECEMPDLIAAVQENWHYRKRGKKKFPRLVKTEKEMICSDSPSNSEFFSYPKELCLWANIGLKTESEVVDVLKKMTFVPVPQRRSVAEFFLFMYLRHEWFHACQRQKLTGAPAITPNRAIREYDFCNMYRELDEDSQWIRQRLAGLYTGKSMTRRQWILQVLWFCYNFRQVGRTDTFVNLGFPKLMFQEPKKMKKDNKVLKSTLSMAQVNEQSVKTFLKGMRKLMANGSRVFTGDYQTPPIKMYEKFIMKVIANDCALLHHVADAILDYDPSDRLFNFFHYHKNICDALQALPGVASFFGCQIFCDIEEAGCIPSHPSMSLTQLNEGPTDPPYILLGGGARKGLNVVFGHDTVPYSQQLQEVNLMLQNQLVLYKALGLEFAYWNGQSISGKVLEHALCEYYQYCRLVDRMKCKDQALSRHRRACPIIGNLLNCATCTCSGSTLSFLCNTCGRPFCSKCWLEPVSDPNTMICTQCESWTSRYERLSW